jgi:hypothetical protein
MAGQRWRIGAVVVVFGLLLFVAGFVAGASTAHEPAQVLPKKPAGLPLVAVYGDSLVVQARPYLAVVAANLGVSVIVGAVGGTAPCDSLPTLRRDVAVQRITVVVWAFSGNSQSPCMATGTGSYLTGAAKLAKYRTDTQAAIDVTDQAGAKFVLASPPANRTGDGWGPLDAMYRGLVFANQAVRYADAGESIAPDGHFAATQTCLPFERAIAGTGCTSATSVIAVRGEDGAHFCQVPFGAPCEGYSSGALRYAINLLSAARLDLDSAAVTPVHSVRPSHA